MPVDPFGCTRVVDNQLVGVILTGDKGAITQKVNCISMLSRQRVGSQLGNYVEVMTTKQPIP
jgi:hypothetical protein